ncbi:MAG: ester cyclase [Chloroflexi bacterium]|nr:ester cyclase [Chloroflexota bacterium]
MESDEAREHAKALVRRWVEEAVNQGRLEVLDEIIHPAMVNHEKVTPLDGREGFRQTLTFFQQAIADQRMELLDLIAEGDRVAARLVWSGRPKNPFLGRPVNGRPFRVTHTHIFRVEDGMLAEHWANRDDLGMWQQISTRSVFGEDAPPAGSGNP